MRVGKGGDPRIGVGSYVLVGLCMQLGQNLHMQAREPGGEWGGGKRCFLAKRKKGFSYVFRGEKATTKRGLYWKFHPWGID